MKATATDSASERGGGGTLTLRSYGRADRQIELAPHLFLVMQAGCNRVAPLRIRLGEVDEVKLSRASERRVEIHSDGQRCSLEIGVADNWMSSNHATLVRDATAWQLIDRGSKNGSRIDGRRQHGAALHDGAVIEMGRTFFIFRAAVATLGDAPRWASVGSLEDGNKLATMLPELARHFAELARLAASKSSIVIHGPTGSGKELLAHAVHALSGRRGRFVAVNCAALPDGLIESELFGQVRGECFGAMRDHKGIFEMSGGGTLFLDEIGDLPAQAQSKLLRALQKQAVRPVGGDDENSLDLRVIAATHRDLEALVAAGAFREDLLARLGASFKLPPLRERREDLGLIINGLLDQIADPRASRAELSSEVVRALFNYTWPRNICELQKCLEQAIALAQDGPIELIHLPDEIRSTRPQPAPHRSDPALLSDEERVARFIELQCAHCGNIEAIDPVLKRPLMKHTVLFLAANPLGTDRLGLDREARAIQVELERSGFRDSFTLETRWAAEPLDLLRELRKLKPTVVHFSGHGSAGAGAVQHGLIFQTADGHPKVVSAEALEQAFDAAGSSVKLVVLNACYSEPQAAALLTRVDCVVGMRGSFLDDAARSFAIGFYGGLGERESIAAAYKQGCAAISLEGLRDGDRPQLRTRDGIDAAKLVLATARPAADPL